MATPAPGVAAAPAPPTAEAPAVVAHFSVTQANRGRDTFRSRCTECHTSTEFSDSSFKFKWSRRTVGDLYEFISTSMPDDAPGSLTPAQSIDIVTYIMQMNDFATGPRELPAEQARLDAISMAQIREG